MDISKKGDGGMGNDILSLILALKSRGIKLKLSGDSLIINNSKKDRDADLLAQVKERKDEIKVFLKKYKKNKGSYENIPIVEKKEYYPLSSAQKRLFILQQMMPDSNVYNMPLLLEISGTINKELFEGAIEGIIERHESLRTSFHLVGGEAVQIIHKKIDFKVFYHQEAVKDPLYLVKDFCRSFHLDRVPLIRAGLFPLKTGVGEPGRFVLMVDMHHIICDGFSMDIMVKEFVEFYMGKKMAPLEIQYRDFSNWQNREKQQNELLTQADFWKEQFKGNLPVLNLPYDFPRQPVHRFKGKTYSFQIGSRVTAFLSQKALELGTTMYAVCLALFSILLTKHSDQVHVIIGTPVSGRRHAELNKLIGMFVNTLAIPLNPEPSYSFNSYLQQVKRKTLDCFSNQDYPFEDLVDSLSIERDSSRNPLFDVFFALQNLDFPRIDLEGFSVKSYSNKDFWNITKFDLTLTGMERGGKLFFAFQYSSDLFSEETIQRFAQGYKHIAKIVTSNFEIPIYQIDPMDEKYRLEILEDFNRTEKEFPRDKSLFDLFLDRAQSQPGKTAIYGRSLDLEKNVTITFGDLLNRCTKAAKFLVSRGVGTGSPVVLSLDRSVDALIWSLSIMAAGAIYIPVPPEYPEERKKYMLADSASVHIIDFTINTIEDEPVNVPGSKGPGPDDCAYIIYTSGTTGRPKGIPVNHRALINLCSWHNGNFDVHTGVRAGQFASMGFDASIWEIFPNLLAGAELYIVPEHLRMDPIGINRYFEKYDIHTAFLPTQFAEQFMELENRSLRLLLTGGDKLKGYKVNGKYRVINNYGPTENTVVTTSYPVTQWQENIPIGTPIANNRIMILNPGDLKLQPLGVTGELCVAGESLARGYLNKPELTHQYFCRAPMGKSFSTLLGTERFYRTGDLARLLPSGILLYQGRRDRQVKIRGYRIEPGEIEFMLSQHPMVREAVVKDWTSGSKETFLCAYLVLEDKDQSHLESIKAYLGEKLPVFMVPEILTAIDEMPLSSSGKIDREQLPRPIREKTGSRELAFVPASGSLEIKIAAIWQEVLGLEKVSVEANFFEVGGNSMALMKVHHKLTQSTGIEIPMTTLFRLGTIRQIAGFLETKNIPCQTPDTIPERADVKTSNKESPGEYKNGNRGSEIAVIGMALHFPGADSIDEFWQNLVAGKDSISHFTREELLTQGINPETLDNPNYVRAWGVIRGKEFFDAAFFGYLPQEARVMDPQIRLFHQTCWEALEDAAIDPQKHTGSIGLYAGAGANLNWEVFSMLTAGQDRSMDSFSAGQLRNRDFISSRVSYRLNLKGPAVFVNTACSTSLVAVHLACGALLNGEAHVALAGGVTLTNHLKTGYFYQEGMIYSPDGKCRAFDAQARGTVGGEGAGVVVLKPLKEAVDQGDHIWAVIKGSAMNNDGSRKVGFSAPSVDGQADVIRMAHRISQVEPVSISYIEAHGTGTNLGDPIEVEALKLAFGPSAQKYCALGAVKANIGHLDAAAGVAGLIKAILVLHHEKIPAVLNYSKPNPGIDFEGSPFYVNQKLSNPQMKKGPFRAGVSSFGMGGTNAHLVLESAPQQTGRDTPGRSVFLLPFSAQSPEALQRMKENYHAFLQGHPDLNPADLAYTLQIGRKMLQHRGMLVCRDLSGAIEALAQTGLKGLKHFSGPLGAAKVVMMFPGQGTLYQNMGVGLYEEEPVFRRVMDHCFEILEKESGEPIKPVLYPGNESLSLSAYSQPLLFAFEYALARLLQSWGLEPHAMIGYSTGEYTAACLSGVISPEEVLPLIASRGRLMDDLPPGVMLSVPMNKSELLPLLDEYEGELSLAVDNGVSCIISGNRETTRDFARAVKKKKIFCMELKMAHAGHSQAMESIMEGLEQSLAQVKFQEPGIPYISTVSGDWITPTQACDPKHWLAHARQTVRFADGLDKLLTGQPTLFLEVGPGKILSGFVRQHRLIKPHHHVIDLVKESDSPVDDMEFLLERIGRMWLFGKEIDWDKFYGQEKPLKLSLPTYPFEKTVYPVQADAYKLISSMIAGKTGEYNPLTQGETIPVEPQNQPLVTGSRPGLVTPYVSPANQMEEDLAQIWEEFFGFDRIGVMDDFFELGGDSLKAMRLLTLIHKDFSVQVSLETFFKEPRIRDLAIYLQDGKTQVQQILFPVEKKEYYPLSAAQKRTYILQQMELKGTAYNEPQLIPVNGTFNQQKMEEAFKTLIQRHESLRTSFFTVEESPVQKIHPSLDMKFSIEITPIPSDSMDLEKHINGIFKEFIRPFNLASPPLLRAGVVLDGDICRCLMLDIHHIITDGTSQGILVQDFNLIYEGQNLPALEIQYKDYAYWLNLPATTVSLGEQEAYWLEQFSNEVPIMDLPTDFPRPRVQSFAGKSFEFSLEESICRGLRERAAASGATLYMILLAALNVFLARVTNREDVVVGTPVAGRRNVALQPVVGMFVNTLAMRQFPMGSKKFASFLKEVKERTLQAFANQEYPFEELVEKLDLVRDLSRNPLFDVMFALQNQAHIPGGKEDASPREIFHKSAVDTSKFDMALYGVEVGERVVFLVEYCTGLFKQETMERLVGYFKNTIIALLENPGITLGEVDILSPGEREELEEFSRGPLLNADIPGAVHLAFQKQVQENPHRIALVGPSALTKDLHSVSYTELNRRSNLLAHRLVAMGVKNGTVVAAHLEKSCEMISAMMAVFKAGGTYLPVDTEYPEQRKIFMLKESGARFLLGFEDVAELAVGLQISLVSPVSKEEKPDPGNLKRKSIPKDPLYIIYTSGSTGKPKATLLEHGNLLNLIYHQFSFTDIDFSRVMQFAATGFDVSFQEILSTLLAGGQLHLVDRETRVDLPLLFNWIEKWDLTTLFLPTALVKFLASQQEGGAQIPGGVKHIAAAGEQLTVPAPWAVVLEERGISLHNHYGPSETHVITTHTMKRAAEIPYLPPIGKPLANTSIHLTNSCGLLQPPGVAGELRVGGAQVGRGYLNNPEATAEKFQQGTYKTGDLARWLPGGILEFLGRADSQLKIRGYRVEPGEVENKLLEMEVVEEALVMAQKDPRGENLLCAYLVLTEDSLDAAPDQIRGALAELLPPFLVPTHIIIIEEFPLTPNGKVNRKQLPPPDIKGKKSNYQAPSNDMEELLVEIWSQVLFGKNKNDVAPIGIHDNFFELGGHSLSATVVIAKIKSKVGVALSLTEIFKMPTIRGIASIINALNWADLENRDSSEEQMEMII